MVVDRRFGTALAVLVALMGVAFDVLGLMGVPTSAHEWAFQNGLIGGAALLMAILWMEELDAGVRRLVAVVVRRR